MANAYAAEASPPARRSVVVAWMVSTQLLSLLSLLPWVVAATISLMAFDTPGATERWGVWATVIAVWLYPLFPLGCAALAWVAFARRRLRRAVVWTTLPLLPTLAMLGYLGWVSLES